MVQTALDTLDTPPCSRLLGWHILDARPEEGWIRIGFEGKAEFCKSCRLHSGRHPVGDA
jgi:hypothetical protein